MSTPEGSEVQKVSARLFAILAREAPLGVIFRRGPSKWVEIILWHTDADTFERGQWFKGRIYERRCDLSPNGSLFIYFAQKIEKRTLQDAEYTYAWTAISKPPYITALALWPKGDCWHGGGLFLDRETVWLNHKPEVAVPHPKHPPTGLTVISNPEAYGESEPIYYKRLRRDGWTNTQEGIFHYEYKGGRDSAGKRAKSWTVEKTDIWERPHPSRPHSLIMEWVDIDYDRPVGGSRVDEFRVVDQERGVPTDIDDAEWADWDQQGRLVFVRHGKLFTSLADEFNPNMIADFNSDQPTEIIAPNWATEW